MNRPLTAEEATLQLFELYADDVYRFARYVLPDAVDPKDVVQEVFLRAFRHWDRYRADSNPRTWLLSIARNYIYDALRKRRTETNFQHSHRPDFSEVTVPFESLVELEHVVSQLSPNYRKVFILRVVQDLTVAETADVLGWSQAKVKTTLHRALRHLRTALYEEPSTAMVKVMPKTGG